MIGDANAVQTMKPCRRHGIFQGHVSAGRMQAFMDVQVNNHVSFTWLALYRLGRFIVRPYQMWQQFFVVQYKIVLTGGIQHLIAARALLL